MSLILNRTRRKSVVRYETETLDLKARIVAATGTIQDDALRWVDDFVIECKARGVWSELIEVGLFVGDQLAAALVKLKHAGTGTLTNTNFVGGDYTERGASGGLLGAATKFLNTSYTLQGSAAKMLGFYNRTVMDNSVNRTMMGGSDGATFGALSRYTPGEDVFEWNNDFAALLRTSTTGLYAGTKQTDTDWRLWHNGALLNLNVQAANSTLPNRTVYLWARNNAGVADQFWTGRGSFYCIGTVNMTGVVALTDAVGALQSKLGRV